jgi:5-methylcytosine-specific restriction protein B
MKYIKKIQKQDVEKSFFISKEAFDIFFIEKPLEKSKTPIVFSYNNVIITAELQNEGGSDFRIINFKNKNTGKTNRPSYTIGDLIVLTKKNNFYILEIIPHSSNEFIYYNLLLGSKTHLVIEDIKSPINQILFGPPGTGKTYSTIIKALNIIGLLEEKDSYSKEEYEAAQELFQNELGKRIEFVTMHQSFSYEDFVQGLKPRKSDDGKDITFYYKNGVFKAICERADESKLLLKRSTTTEETILIDKLFPSFLLSIDEQSVYDTLSAKKFEGKKITQKIAIEYFNEKLGKKYCKAWRDKFDYVLGIKSPRVGYQADKFRDGELEDFKEYSKTFEKLTPEKRKEKLITEWIDDKPETIIVENILNNHVIILDEINRANISRVFGELIALIEKDKRDGKLTATLPSGDPFTVPSNLFIIGTMNTADKSIALVDIALRRRFKFIPLYPNSELLRSVLKENKIEQEEIEKRVNLMTNLNKIIRAKKSVDFEIGHSYFMENETLINILNNQVLPLLNEYFMYDLRKVKEIIEKTQKDKEGNNIPKLGINLNQSIWKDRGLLEVESIDTEAELVEDALDEADENNSDS